MSFIGSDAVVDISRIACDYSEDEHESETRSVGGVGDGGGSCGRIDTDRLIGNIHDNDLDDKPTYLLEHLATFTVNKDSGIIYPADGMRRLLQLEKTTGIWSQKMQLCLDYKWVLIIDYETGNIIERFPANLIQEPTAFTTTDAMELYNNILVFIVSGIASDVRSEMHIFQSQSVSALHLVEDLRNLRNGKLVMQQRKSVHHYQQQHQHMPQKQEQQQFRHMSYGPKQQQQQIATATTGHEYHHYQHSQQQVQNHHHRTSNTGTVNTSVMEAPIYGGVRTIIDTVGDTDSEHGVSPGAGHINDESSSTSSGDKYERDVTVLNHCFDDIEKFIARLQHAAAATRELERRRRNRKTKKKNPGEGLLTLRTRPPHEKEFIDIFAKFKLSFNLLAKLKAHIHDPNAPELVHFLFTPLALIVEASSDTYHELQLPARVAQPLLTRDAINLLINCVTSKETELWRSLGDVWIVPRDKWKDDVGSYHPVFLDGWSPDYLVIDELIDRPTAASSAASQIAVVASTPTNITNRRHYQHLNNSTHHMELNDVNGSNGGMGSRMTTGIMTSYDDFDGQQHYHHAQHAITDDSMIGTTTMATKISAAVGGPAPDEISVVSIDRSGGATALSHHSSHHRHTAGYSHDITAAIRDMKVNSGKVAIYSQSMGGTTSAACDGDGFNPVDDQTLLETWLDDLQAAGVKIVLVTYPRTANNDKELSVVRGEYLEILDDTRKWWKARNKHGQIAHVPHTIVTPYNYAGGIGILRSGSELAGGNQYFSQNIHSQRESAMTHHQPQQHQQKASGDYKISMENTNRSNYNKNYTNVSKDSNDNQLQQHYQQYRFINSVNKGKSNNNQQDQQHSTDWISNKHLGKKGEFRYF